MSGSGDRQSILRRERVQRCRERTRAQHEHDANLTRRDDDEWLDNIDEWFDSDSNLYEQPVSEMESVNSGAGCDMVGDDDDDPAVNIQECSMKSVYSSSHSDLHNQNDHDGHQSFNETSFEHASASDDTAGHTELFSSDGEIDNSICDDEDDEDELRPASITEDDIETLEDDFFQDDTEISQLREWVRKNPRITLTQVTELLQILRQRLLPQLPKCAQTFLGTTKAKYDIQIDAVDGSEFVYFGLIEQLKRQVNPQLHDDKIIHLVINVDGLRLYQSSSKQFWPILCSIYFEENVYKPFPVAIHSGTKKPRDVDKYLERFVNEINEVQRDGLLIDNQKFSVCIKCFVCDRPARSLLKQIKNHGAYWACERCNVRGEHVERRIIYPLDESSEDRTDDSFREQINPEHHVGQSLLLDITPPINMVTSFVLDFMHLLCLGVMKKLLGYWLHGKSTRLNCTARNLLSNLLLQLQNQIPCEFQRTTRSLTELERFKATEFKFILLYAGPIILKKVLPETMYKHFLLLHVACRILCSKTRAVLEYVNAKRLLVKFVSLMPRIYGAASLIGNVHSLIHLPDDVYNMVCSIASITAFPFENALGKMKRLLRQGNRPLAQICRRLHETFFGHSERAMPAPQIQIERKLLPDRTGKIVVKRVQWRGSTLTDKCPNNTVLLTNKTLLQIDNMYIAPGTDEILISGTLLIKKKPLLSFPCDSDALHMWVITRGGPTTQPYRLNRVLQKMVTLEVSHEGKRKMYTMPLLHM